MYCTRYIPLERFSFIFIATDICSGIKKEGFEELSFFELNLIYSLEQIVFISLYSNI